MKLEGRQNATLSELTLLTTKAAFHYLSTRNFTFPVTISTSNHCLQSFSVFVKQLVDIFVVLLAWQVADLQTAATLVSLAAVGQHVGHTTTGAL